MPYKVLSDTKLMRVLIKNNADQKKNSFKNEIVVLIFLDVFSAFFFESDLLKWVLLGPFFAVCC